MRQLKNGMLMNENRETRAKFRPAHRQQRNKEYEITTTQSAQKCNIPLDSCTNPSVTPSGWRTCQPHNCSTLANFISFDSQYYAFSTRHVEDNA